jgi:hypothetical protein
MKVTEGRCIYVGLKKGGGDFELKCSFKLHVLEKRRGK